MANSNLSPAAAATVELATNDKVAPQTTPSAGLLDLEKELTCSICTDILYQPLTLLDCLHTFCGSCLKEWFSWQAAAARQKQRQEGRSTSLRNLYTCPSCRASVRETRPNATVTTLLDMYLQANPTMGKSEDEKKQVAEHFKLGESVLPQPLSSAPSGPGRRHRGNEDEDDRRLMDEVRQMSLRELERRGTRASRGEGERRRDERNRRRDEMIGTSSAGSERTIPVTPRRERADRSPRPTERESPNSPSLEHQSSLRSLISSSDLNSQEMEEEIMRQILEEGLLDGIDLSNIDRHDEDEISERIAQAYRRRQSDRAREQDGGARRNPAQGSQDQTRRDISPAPPSSYHLGPPPTITEPRSGRRSSSQGGSSSARLNQPGRASSDDISRTGARTSTDSSSRLEANVNGRQHRRVTSHERQAGSEAGRPSSDRSRAAARTAPIPISSSTSGHPEPAARQTSTRGAIAQQPDVPSVSVSADDTPQASRTSLQVSHPRDLSVSKKDELEAPTVAPFRYCSSCAKPRIQYDVHYTCSKCSPTTGSNMFALCHRCYRLGKGCHHWFGFGDTVWSRFQQQFPQDSQREPPHIMTPARYVQISTSEVNDEVRSYHQVGVFCDVCFDNANSCYWSCSICNEGEWGFCNNCVNQAKHCTHPILPLAWNVEETTSSHQSSPQGTFTPLPVHTDCNVCSNPIPPSNTRFHCPSCNDGDYDICVSCYHTLVSSGKVSVANGPKGWRKCENGHRMVIIGFESRSDGQRRILLENVIGGWQMRDEDTGDSALGTVATEGQAVNGLISHSHWSWRDTTSGSWKSKKRPTSQGIEVHGVTSATGFASTKRLPPAGGFGFKMSALWTRVPDDGVEDELMFPKWAEITEVLDINEDWCWGVYCTRSGLFPEGFGRVVS